MMETPGLRMQETDARTIDQAEVARFSRLAGQWWDPRGPMAALH
jgi:2-polyprenyl-6-hydroxyphenyl methylase/3-demethylubiquinone-9 3-methyltransferase